MEVTVLYWMMKILPHHGVGTYSTSIISLSFPFGLNKFFFPLPFTVHRSPYQKRGEPLKNESYSTQKQITPDLLLI